MIVLIYHFKLAIHTKCIEQIVCIYSVKVELVSVQWNSALQQKGITLPIPQPQKSTMMYRAVYLKLGTCEISNVWNIKCIEYIFCTIYIMTSGACNPAYPSTTEVHDDVTGPVDRQHRCSQILQLLTFSLMAFLWEIYKCIQLSKKNLFFRRWMKNIFLFILPECLLLYNI